MPISESVGTARPEARTPSILTAEGPTARGRDGSGQGKTKERQRRAADSVVADRGTGQLDSSKRDGLLRESLLLGGECDPFGGKPGAAPMGL